MRTNQIAFHLYIAIFVILLMGCTPKPILPPTSEKFGCNQPPPDVFSKVGIDVKFAESTFGKIVTGDIDIQSNPGVISLASVAVTDYRIKSYLRCLAIKRDGFTPEQAAYFEHLSAFMSTKPSPQDFLEWQKINKFPSAATEETCTEYKPPDPTYVNEIFAQDQSDSGVSSDAAANAKQDYYIKHFLRWVANCGKVNKAYERYIGNIKLKVTPRKPYKSGLKELRIVSMAVKEEGEWYFWDDVWKRVHGEWEYSGKLWHRKYDP